MVKRVRKQVWIIGMGFGGRRLMTRQEAAALKYVQLFIGKKRSFELAKEYIDSGHARWAEAGKPAQIRRMIAEAPEERIAILLNEDPACSGELTALMHAVGEFRPYVFPGVSLVSYAASRAGISASDAVTADLAAGQGGLVPLCRRHRKVIVKCGPGIRKEISALMAAGFRDMKVCLLTHPASEEEELFTGRLYEVASREIENDSVLLLIRPNALAGSSSALKDSDYLNAGRGVTPEDVRAVVLHKMAAAPEDTIYIIGAGCGDTAVEAAAMAERGSVYAIEKDAELAGYIRKNCERHGARNVRVIEGEAPGALGHLPPADVVLITGTPESVVDLIQIAMSRNPDVRIVIQTGSIEKASAAAAQIEAKKLDLDFIQLAVMRGEKHGGGHALKSGNAYFILSARAGKTEGNG